MLNRKNHCLRTVLLFVSLCICLFSQECTSPRIVAVIRSKKAGSPWKKHIRVFIRFSSRSLLENRLAVMNSSESTVAIYPVDVTLEIPDAEITLPAVVDFNDYVSKRYSNAKKRCKESTRQKRCTRYVTRFFDHYSAVRTFTFGEIPSRGKREGYFAFNLPDPFNTSAQSRQATRKLKEKGRTVDGTIRVVVTPVTFEAVPVEFTFPVKVIISKDEKPELLRIMKYF